MSKEENEYTIDCQLFLKNVTVEDAGKYNFIVFVTLFSKFVILTKTSKFENRDFDVFWYISEKF